MKILNVHLLRFIVVLLSVVYNIAFANDLPGAEAFPTELQDKLHQSVASKSSQYALRTEHLDENSQPLYTNRLIFEDSPYLLQHAHNPVNWYAWEDEAFAQAKKSNKPIFLSIGYSTCHWCHVMEKESFEDIEIARYLNEHFISIKVDRERRPDIDKLYMTGVMLVKGRGGWPMSNFLLASGKPFFTDTYIPPDQFLVLLKDINQSWQVEQDIMVDYANELSLAVENAMLFKNTSENINDKVLQNAEKKILLRHDELNGGFGGPTKFPNETSLLFLLQMFERDNDDTLLAIIEHTLQRMAQGGIYDHVGGGFHRYSTDNEWRIPHFEKMLYNQANLARVYLNTYHLTGKNYYARVARQTLDYVLRDMMFSKGGFYSATDADSEGKEGANFIWTSEEIASLFSVDDLILVNEYYGITEQGNYEGQNILYTPKSHEEFIQFNSSEKNLSKKIDAINQVLMKARNKRIKPLRDEKIIVSWNSMLIIALAKASHILNQIDYLNAAIKTANYLWSEQVSSKHELLRVNLHGRASVVAMQEDYASFSEAMITLYDITGDKVWLDRAILLTDVMIKKFWKEKQGNFSMGDASRLFTQPVDDSDSATPSGNSIAMHVFIKLSQRTFNIRYKEYLSKMMNAFSSRLYHSPAAYAYMLAGVDEYLHGISDSMDYSDNGVIKVDSQYDKDNHSLQVVLKIHSGWHINSHNPIQDYLVPLNLSLKNKKNDWEIKDVNYPEPILKTLGFVDETLSLYENTVLLKADLFSQHGNGSSKNRELDVHLQVQACNDELCLPPENITLELMINK